VKVDKLGKDATAEEKAEMRKRILSQQMRMGLGKAFNDAKTSVKVNNILVPTLEEPKSEQGMVPQNRVAPQLKPAPKPQPAQQPAK
jgi:hypothetical protein